MQKAKAKSPKKPTSRGATNKAAASSEGVAGNDGEAQAQKGDGAPAAKKPRQWKK